MESKFSPRVFPECGPKCRSRRCAAALVAVLGARNAAADDADVVNYAARGDVACGNAGKVVDERGMSGLHAAAGAGRKAAVQWMLKCKGANINAKEGESAYTPLHRY